MLPKSRHDVSKHVNVRNISNEVSAMRKLQGSRHNVELLDCFQDDENVYMVQELCKNGNLDNMIKTRRKNVYTEYHIARLSKRLVQAVAECHERGIYHGDVKPANVLLCRFAQLKLGDFGNSLETNSPVDGCFDMRGTPWYVAPEILEGQYGYNADMWAVGIIVFGLMFGSHPFYKSESLNLTSKDMHDLLTSHTLGGIDVNQTYSRVAKDFVQKLLIVDPSKRLMAKEALVHPWLRNM